MDLPINDQDLETIVKALALGGDSRLFFKLKEVKEERDKDLVLKNGIVGWNESLVSSWIESLI